MKVHEVKISSKYFTDVANGIKTFEVRKNDRDYQVGDILVMSEIVWIDNIHKKETGRKTKSKIIYILDDPLYLRVGYVVLGIKLI